MDHRKEELEKKRAKLAELRRQREERKRQATQTREQLQPASPTASRIDINDLVNSLVGERSRSRSNTGSESALLSRESSESAASGAPDQPAAAADTPRAFRTAEMVVIDFPPRERVVYNKGVQTAATDAGSGADADAALLSEAEVARRVREQRERDERARAAREEDARVRAAEAAEREAQREAEARRLTDTQLGGIRALDTDYDVTVDYARAQAGDASDARPQLALVAALGDERTRNRAVMDLAWSARFPELVAAAYNRNPTAPNEPDGVVAVWNAHSRARPEFVFHAPSDVLQVAFSDFDAHLLVGAAYSGQLLLWDTRAKAQPVLRTPLTAAGHTHPVYALKVVGSTNAHHVVSASSDGLACAWQLDMLAQPQDALDLTNPAHARTDEVSGVAYPVNRYDRAGCKAGLNALDAYRAHTAPINSLRFHPPGAAADFADLFLTASSDWTVRLWRARPAAKPASAVPTDMRPLHTFDAFDDYVYDARWSPVHPAVFASADGAGRLALWNLNADVELPVYAAHPESGRALNKLAWDRPGRRIATGGADGLVYLYDVGDLATPRPDDAAKFARVVAEMASA
ncbi:WD40-repeat-containing domain protein [Kickxella alabastrina]|uniref:WD40-repeat-containing domain protein n=1 Tax=Kickxella alabastrina TaxID=61397 RepID=UPI00221E8FFE|nr:WD40-repeat-containing domain protein [Kickxella alabastrina]KAI7829174.1 WD40-repeat-containing domain protein [Kickxella alabastrina]